MVRLRRALVALIAATAAAAAAMDVDLRWFAPRLVRLRATESLVQCAMFLERSHEQTPAIKPGDMGFESLPTSVRDVRPDYVEVGDRHMVLVWHNMLGRHEEAIVLRLGSAGTCTAEPTSVLQ